MNSTSETRSSPRSLRELWGKVQGLDTAILTTVHQDGVLNSRPMATQAIEAQEFLWFFAARDSGKVQAIRANPQVAVTYAYPRGNTYVTASGIASVCDNDAKARQFWSKAAQSWFPAGPEDSGLVLIRVDVEHAQWWDGSESREIDLG